MTGAAAGRAAGCCLGDQGGAMTGADARFLPSPALA